MDNQALEYLRRYREGDIEALGELIEHYRRPLFSFILRMTEGQRDAEDLFQEIWLRAVKNLPRFKGHKLISWLFRIAHNLVIDEVRRDERRGELPLSADGEPERAETFMREHRLGPDAEYSATDLGERIREAIKVLPSEQREVFLMRVEGDLPFKDIARIQRVSINTALARMHYALRRLREELKHEWDQ